MLTSTIVTTFFAFLPLTSAFSNSGNNNVAIYWGQNSAGKTDSQKNLAYYCSTPASDVVLISFLNQFFAEDGLPSINLGPSCGGTTFDGTNLLSCPDVGTDIATCQSQGKKILLSLGGASGAYGFTSADQATEFANTLWNLFGGGSSSTRPFGAVKIDGFDLDIEGGSNQYYDVFVNQMRSNYATDSSKQYYISGAPQCPIPDHMLNPSMTTSDFDMYFVQFYNNYCGLGAFGTDNFNFAAWDTFAKTQSKNPNAKVYLGVPGGPTAAGSGYVDADQVIKIANELQSNYSSFGGVSIWDASQAWENNDFANQVKAGLGGGVQTPADVVISTSVINRAPVATTSSSSTVQDALSSSLPAITNAASPEDPTTTSSSSSEDPATTSAASSEDPATTSAEDPATTNSASSSVSSSVSNPTSSSASVDLSPLSSTFHVPVSSDSIAPQDPTTSSSVASQDPPSSGATSLSKPVIDFVQPTSSTGSELSVASSGTALLSVTIASSSFVSNLPTITDTHFLPLTSCGCFAN